MKRKYVLTFEDELNSTYAFLVEYQAKNGRSPSRREIAAATGLSLGGAVEHRIKAMMKRGWIKTNPHTRGALELIRKDKPAVYKPDGRGGYVLLGELGDERDK